MYTQQQGFWDDFGSGLKKVSSAGLDVVKAVHESKVRQKVQQEQAANLAAQQAQRGALGGYGPYLLVGGVVLAGILLLRR
jgi:hypothetical protein